MEFIFRNKSYIFYQQTAENQKKYDYIKRKFKLKTKLPSNFKKKRESIFIEVGAYDGVKLSNTYFFKKELGWSGICVEPVHSLFQKLELNRKCVCFNKSVSDKIGKSKFLHFIGGDQYEVMEDEEYPKVKGKEHTEMLSGLVDYYNPKHTNLINREL